MTDILRQEYFDFIKQHGLQPRLVPENAKDMQLALLKHLIEDSLRQKNTTITSMLKEKYEEINQNENVDRTNPHEILISRATREIENSITKVPSLAERFEHNVFTGEFPTGSFNAQSVKVKNGYLVLLNTGSSFLIKQLIEAVTYQKFEKPEDIKMDAQHVSLIRNIIVEYLKYEDPTYGAKPLAGGFKMFLNLILSEACDKFIIGHEYGHILSGHFQEDKCEYEDLKTKYGKIETIKKNWAQELEADTVAYQILLETKDYKDINLSILDNGYKSYDTKVISKAARLKSLIAAPFLIYAINIAIRDIYNAMNETSKFKLYFSETHPSTEMRMKNLFDKISPKVKSEHFGFTHFGLLIIKASEKIVEEINNKKTPDNK